MEKLGWVLISVPALAFVGVIVWMTFVDWVATWATIGVVALVIACALSGAKLLNR